jgi:hypothetical protein
MRTSCNPGSYLECVGSFELVGEDEQFVLERESQTIVELSTLMQSFREDLSSPIIGTVRITIEPAPISQR